MSITTQTRCSSTPSAEIFVNAPAPRGELPFQHARSAPAFDADGRSRFDRHRIGRQHVDDCFEIARIADLDQRGPARRDRLAFLSEPQNTTRDRSRHGQALVCVRLVIAVKQRPGLIELMLGRMLSKLRRP